MQDLLNGRSICPGVTRNVETLSRVTGRMNNGSGSSWLRRGRGWLARGGSRSSRCCGAATGVTGVVLLDDISSSFSLLHTGQSVMRSRLEAKENLQIRRRPTSSEKRLGKAKWRRLRLEDR
jgi:hypothetical protein